MASAGTDAIGEAEVAAGSIKKSRRRISDYLGESDDGVESSPPPSPETPPQLRLPRFTCARFRFVRFGRKRDGRKEVIAAKKTEDSSAGSKPVEETSTSSSASAEAGGGMGLSMLLLLARTCVELNRMAEVRAQMEALLKEMRDEAGRMKAIGARHHQHDFVVTPRTTTLSNIQLSSSTTTGSSSSCTTDTHTNHHHHHHATSEEGEGKQAEGEERCSGSVVELLELEATESEAEPEPQHRPSLLCDDTDQDESSDDEFIELDGGLHFGGVSSDIKWDAGDVSEEESTCEQDGGGVSAAELERQLHELLHRRNRDRIAELESALRRAEQRLREKEMEARLWQDTATLALQPPRDGL